MARDRGDNMTLRKEINGGVMKVCDLISEFFSILETTEESDSGKEFHPVYISSCRVMKTKRIEEIISEIKKIIGYQER